MSRTSVQIVVFDLAMAVQSAVCYTAQVHKVKYLRAFLFSIVFCKSGGHGLAALQLLRNSKSHHASVYGSHCL